MNHTNRHILPSMFLLPLLFPAAIMLAAEGPGGNAFPDELVSFGPASEKAAIAGTGTDTWDRKMRERGWIFREDGIWHLYHASALPDWGEWTTCRVVSEDLVHWKKSVTGARHKRQTILLPDLVDAQVGRTTGRNAAASLARPLYEQTLAYRAGSDTSNLWGGA